ncbi:MAG TPA: hypothetical protein DCS05_03960 [Nitrospiraceae bacterium]|nr:hypothetical protein [Nitrospiraceae bacterium]
MSSHGILMSAPMVRAWLAGEKGETRRLRGLDKVNQDPDNWEVRSRVIVDGQILFTHKNNALLHYVAKFPWRHTGELYFKETFQLAKQSGSVGDEWIGDEILEWDGRLPKEKPELFWDLYYRADDEDIVHWWRPSIFMPRWASRICTKLTGARLERLHDITVEGVQAEGIDIMPFISKDEEGIKDVDEDGFIGAYADLWDKLNGKTMSWKNNPWVWILEFERNHQPVGEGA